MLFFMIGFFRSDLRSIPQELEQMTNDFVGQPLIPIRTAGALHDASGTTVGMMIVVELGSYAEANSFMGESPFLKANLYDELRILRYTPEVGS